MSESEKRPEIVVFAGPNGSGKSTFTELLKPPMDYITADPIINVWRVKLRVESVMFAIYDNFCDKPFRIFKKRKDELYYGKCNDWYFGDIQALTQFDDLEKRVLNKLM